MISWTVPQSATPRTLLAFLCLCFAPSAFAKLGETVPQLVKRFGKSYTVESVQVGRKYKFRSANVSVDVVVSNGFSVAETYLSDHPLTASGEPPNDIVRAVLRTNSSKAQWIEIEAAQFRADYALRSSDGEYIAILNYTGPQPENMIWTMTVGLAKSVHAVSTVAPSSNSSPSPFVTPSPSAPAAGTEFPPLRVPEFKLGVTPSPSKPHRESFSASAVAEYNTGLSYYYGQGVEKDFAEAVKWFRKAAEQNYAPAQGMLGSCYHSGQGVSKNYAEAVKWLRKAAEQNDAWAQSRLGYCYHFGQGVPKDYVEEVKWLRKAAEQNDAGAQGALASCYHFGWGVPKDYVEAYKWLLLAAAQGNKTAEKLVSSEENQMSREEIAEGQKLARDFKPRQLPSAGADISGTGIGQTRPESSGTGFFITHDGFLVTNEHVVKDAVQIRLVTSAGLISAKVIKVDSANDLALLKAEGKFVALPVAPSRSMKLGGTVATVGFPNIGLQGFAPKFARGEIGSLSGPQDDARYFQISVPVQPGNSGGALVDERGNVVGIVSATLSAKAALATSGALPQNVSYAVKSSFLLGFLESVPEVAAKLKEPNAKDMKFDDVVEQAKEAAVLVLVY